MRFGKKYPPVGRNAAHTARNLISEELLAGLEAAGDATRFIDRQGQTVWKATPQLRDHLKDLELDARADLEEGE